MNKVFVALHTYNGSASIENAIECVLNQSFPNFVLYIIDNASNDGITAELIEKYRRLDDRIVVRTNEKNMGVYHTFFKEFKQFVLMNPEDNWWFCDLCDDDVYYPTFLEDTLRFALANDLKLAVCQSDYFDVQKQQLVNNTRLQQDLFIGEAEFEQQFSFYFKYLITLWGKLYHFSVFDSVKRDSFTGKISFGWDTAYVLNFTAEIDRFGVLAKSLHKYNIRQGSASFRYDPVRIQSDETFVSEMERFLLRKCGRISAENKEFISTTYRKCIESTVRVVKNSKLDESEQQRCFEEIWARERTKQLFSGDYLKYTGWMGSV